MKNFYVTSQNVKKCFLYPTFKRKKTAPVVLKRLLTRKHRKRKQQLLTESQKMATLLKPPSQNARKPLKRGNFCNLLKHLVQENKAGQKVPQKFLRNIAPNVNKKWKRYLNLQNLSVSSLSTILKRLLTIYIHTPVMPEGEKHWGCQ